jgi:hypothetical protein
MLKSYRSSDATAFLMARTAVLKRIMLFTPTVGTAATEEERTPVGALVSRHSMQG